MPTSAPVNKFVGDMGLLSVVSGLTNLVEGIGKSFIKSASSDSLIEYTGSTRVEPVVLVDHTISDLPVTADVMKSLTSLYAAYYLQSVAISATLNNVKVMRTLDKLNPSRKAGELISVVESLDNSATYTPSNVSAITIPGYEGGDLESKVTVLTDSTESSDEEPLRYSAIDKEDKKAIHDLALNLSTGILINVEIASDNNTVKIPVTIRMISSIVDPDLMVQIATHAAADKSLKARYRGFKTGELSFKDMILATDLIDAHREALVKDKSGIYAEIMNRKNKNKLLGTLSLNPSVSTASNIMILSKSVADDIEGRVGGSIDNEKLRKRIFKDTYLIFLVIIDEQWEKVTIYHRGIKLPTELNFSDVKGAKGDKNTDIMEYLKQYQLGNRPTF